MTDTFELPLNPRYINPGSLVKPSGYNNGVAYGPGGTVVFLAGQIGWDATGRIASDKFDEQFDQALANLLAVVVEAGGRPESIPCDSYGRASDPTDFRAVKSAHAARV